MALPRTLPSSLLRAKPLLLSTLVLLLLAGPAAADAEGDDGEGLVHARLLSEVSALPAGETVLLGVALDVEPGWYVYWKSPGETGMPTAVKFDLPDGFEVEEVRFPVPERRVVAGAVSYIHEGQVTLLATVRVPADLEPGAPVTLRAELEWLVCKEACYMIGRDVALTLDVAEVGPAPAAVAPRGADASRLRAAREALASKGAPEGLRSAWAPASGAGADERQTLSLEVPGADALAFFAWQPDEFLPEDMEARGRAAGPRLELLYPDRVRGRTVAGTLAVTRADTTEFFEVALPGP